MAPGGELVVIYTDGACSGNPGPGGWGAVMRTGDREREIMGGEANTTNNRMELMAAIQGLEALTRGSSAAVYTDSTYVQKGITEWIAKWKRNGWRTAARKPVKNKDLWRRLEAAMEGFQVMSLAEALPIGDIFITLTGDVNVLDIHHFQAMKDGAILANSGHFNVELNIKGLEEISETKRRIREHIEEYRMMDGKRLYLLAEGRLINLAAAEGHPASVMDMSFANQALCVEYIATRPHRLPVDVYTVPSDIDQEVARLKLASMGITIDELTQEQQKYLSSWETGT